MMLDIKTVFICEVHQLQTKLFVCVFCHKTQILLSEVLKFQFFFVSKKSFNFFIL
jgi:hypothetical protein